MEINRKSILGALPGKAMTASACVVLFVVKKKISSATANEK
jgi:hypothetical protein